MKRLYFLFFLFSFFFFSCQDGNRKYVIGVSQCSEDSWRAKLEAELEQSTFFNEDVRLIMCSADDNMEEQCRQIDSLVKEKVDLLIVSPQQVSKLSGAIRHATDAGIPVILFDRKSDAQNYTAFMGADNYSIGKMLAEYAVSQLHGQGNIVEIGGEHGSSPAIERCNGFEDVIKKNPGMHVIAFKEGDWKELSGQRAMEQILDELPQGTRIDCVFGSNDRMTVGAHKAMNQYYQTHKNLSGSNSLAPTLFLGVDALPTPGGGIEQVREGMLTVSAIYPTHGDKLMSLALAILKGEPYEKQNTMETSLVTSDNANVMLLQHKEIDSQHSYIKKMDTRVKKMVGEVNTERALLIAILFIVISLICFVGFMIRTVRAKHLLIKELEAKNDALAQEKATVEAQRDELEEKQDQLLDATLPVQPEPANNAFLKTFMECLDKRLSDSDLSVEDIGSDMLMSRVNLYRKVKAVTGKTPVEIIREERLKRAHVLLQDSSLSISEVAYKVGFSAPSYFTKCYKDYYGKSPSEKE